MDNFWASSVWGFFNIFAVLLMSLLLANAFKKEIRWLQASLIPTSVLGGTILLIIASVYKWISGDVMWDTTLFGNAGSAYLEMTTYHTLALGFIAATLKTTKTHLNKRRTKEIFNTGVTTVSTYLLQGSVGLVITLIAALFVSDFFPASGLLLAFGFGQGTGQAMNYGMIYEGMGFEGGKSFGLTVAAIGFICASFGGVVHMNVMKRQGKLIKSEEFEEQIDINEVQAPNEIPMQESVDKLSIQLALIMMSYFICYIMMYVLGNLISGMKSIIYGFNFLLGVLSATIVKLTLNFMKDKGIVKKEYANNFLLTRTSNFFFDVMVVAGISAIRLDLLQDYWGIIIILGTIGAVFTYLYNRIVAKTLFRRYHEEQFAAMYGMLTGTASTGIILLRELDGDFKTPVADNLVYQNFPAIVLGLPIMFLANYCPKNPVVTLIILFSMFVVLNVILFRDVILGSAKMNKLMARIRENNKLMRRRQNKK